MKLTYIYHSGFAIEAEEVTIIIDYYQDSSETHPDQGVVHDYLLQRPGKIYVLSTHFHADRVQAQWAGHRLLGLGDLEGLTIAGDAGLAARGLLQLDALGDQQGIAAQIGGAGARLGAGVTDHRHRLAVVLLAGDPLDRAEDLVVEFGQLRLVDQSHRTGLEVFGEVFLVQIGVEAVATASGEQGCRQQV